MCPREELNLLQLASGGAAEPSAGPPQVLRCEFADANLCRELLDHVPHQLFGDSFAPWPAGAAHTAEDLTGFDSRCDYPRAQFAVDPVRDGNRPDVASLPAQIDNRSMSLALLQMINRQCGYLMTPKSAGKLEAEQGTVAFTLEPLRLRCLPKSVPLFCRQPVAQSDSQFLYTFDAPDSGSQIGAE
jgi:hypothetical protein